MSSNVINVVGDNTTICINSMEEKASLPRTGGAASSQPVAGLGLRTVDTVTVDKREDSSGHEEQGNDRDVPEIVNSAQAFSGALPMDSFLGVSEAPKSVPLVCSTLKNDQDQRSTHEDENSEDFMRKTFLYLAGEIPREWEKLAICLKVRDGQIKAILLNNPRDVVTQAYCMLQYWWNSSGSVSQSWSECLAKALCERPVGRNDLAKKFFGYVPPDPDEEST